MKLLDYAALKKIQQKHVSERLLTACMHVCKQLTCRADLNDCREPTCVTNVLESNRCISFSPPLQGIQRINNGSSHTHLLHASLSVTNACLQSPEEIRRIKSERLSYKQWEGEKVCSAVTSIMSHKWATSPPGKNLVSHKLSTR